MKPSSLKKLIIGNAKNPKAPSVMIWGSPGIGKSDVVGQSAEELDYDLFDMRLSQFDPVDLRGIPYVKDGVNYWAVPNCLPQPHNMKKKGAILFLDEINGGQKQTMAACYQLILDRRLGDYKVPDNVVIIAAGNNASDRGVTTFMPAPLANRFQHIDAEVNFDDWTEWAIKNDIKTEVLSFLRFRPGLLNDFKPDQRANPTPRAWELVSNSLGTCDPADEFELIAGTVGEGPATEFMSYVKIYRDLPNVDALLLNPKKAEVPKEPATLYALTGAIAERASESNFDRVIDYTLRMPPEFQVVLVRESILRDSSVCNTRSFNDWAAKNSDVLL